MAWDHLAINKPHLVYIILGGFTSIFMLCSLFIKEKLYIGEATVATICGVIFGPHAANLINPLSWGNTDQITLEFSRIVLVVQCFAVGVELPKAYMERHWRSVVFLLVPVMTFGWLITSLFIWWMIVPLNWLESLAVAACVTATDPVLASSVVGKGKFAKRVPKHLRDVLSAESGCNDGMAFPFIYLSVYLLRYNLAGREVVFHWTCYIILYECIFGAVYGFAVGYIGRRAVKFAEDAGLIDRESFLVFYFTLALFCAGSGSMLGMDDLLIGFSAGVGFSNDGSYTEKTEESHVSNVIDLLLNLAYFVYFGTIIPWDQFNAPEHGITPWRLVVIAIFVVFFRRIPAMLMLKPLIPDIKTWREALFAGHFGPIGVGAIFAAILARAEFETDSSEPLAVLPKPGSEEYELILLVWPVVTFLVLTSILVHGSSIAVFTLGRRINTLALTLSYTRDDEGPNWMSRLPRIASQSKSMSRADSMSSMDSVEKPDAPLAIPQNFLRRQKEGESNSRPSSRIRSRSKKKRGSKHHDAGGPIDPSAIQPARRSEPALVPQESGSDTLNEKSQEPSPHSRQHSYVLDEDYQTSPKGSPERGRNEDRSRSRKRGRDFSQSPSRPADVEAFEEGDQMVIEDAEGNVLDTVETKDQTDEEKAQIIEKTRQNLNKDQSGEYTKRKHESHGKTEGEDLQRHVQEAVEHPHKTFKDWRGWVGRSKPAGDVEAESADAQHKKKKQPERKKGPAHAYQFGNTLIVEDEDGEVIKKFTLPPAEGDSARRPTMGTTEMRRGLSRLGTYVGIKGKDDINMEAALRPPPEVQERAARDGTGMEPSSDSDKSQPPKPQRATTTDREQLKRIDRAMKKHDSNSDDEDDNRLRITISKTDRYGWTGLHKEKMGQRPGPSELASSRRFSTKDLMKHLRELDPKTRFETVQEADAPQELKNKVLASVATPAPEGGRKRAGTVPSSSQAGAEKSQRSMSRPETGKRTATDYFSSKPPLSPIGSPNDMTPMSPSTASPEGRDNSPGVERTTTADSVASGGNDKKIGVIPSIDMSATLARHRRSGTAAEERRRRLNAGGEGLGTIRSTSEDEGANAQAAHDGYANETEEPETAAEKRRRLAALGVGGNGPDSDSEEEDMEAPRRVRTRETALQEHEVTKSGSQRPRVQWGGDIGRERELTQEREQLEKQPKQKVPGSGLRKLLHKGG